MSETRLLTEREALAYIRMGRTRGRVWLQEIGSLRHFGRMVRYDRAVIDRHLDMLAQDQSRGA